MKLHPWVTKATQMAKDGKAFVRDYPGITRAQVQIRLRRWHPRCTGAQMRLVFGEGE